jgi:hypothetical protein
MSHSSKSYVEEATGLLVQHFGIKKVQAALRKVATTNNEGSPKAHRAAISGNRRIYHPPIAHALELIRGKEPEKYQLLNEFLGNLKERQVLPESQDIRHFAHLIGLKHIRGKSRKDMIPTLMRFLMEQPIESLRRNIHTANNINERQRRQGFSILADKLTDKFLSQNDPPL